MSRRFVELVVRARRLVTRTNAPTSQAPKGTRLSARRQLGQEVTQFSFRLAFLIDVTYVGIGALAGAAVGHAATSNAPVPVVERAAPACGDTVVTHAVIR